MRHDGRAMRTADCNDLEPDCGRPRVFSHDHVVTLPGSGWSVWRSVALRAPGFPASLVLTLSTPTAAAAADRCLEAAQAIDRARKEILDEIAAAARTADPDARRELWARRRKVQRGVGEIDARTDREAALARAIADRGSLYDAFVAAYDADAEAVHEQATRTASDPRFVEAALWQNHRAFAEVRRKLREHLRRDSGRRRALDFVANLVQRYAVKNDTIGFFGPVGWASISDEASTIDVVPGPALLAGREVFFEGWCIDALADRLNEDPAVRPWTSPRLNAGIWMDATGTVYVPLVGKIPTTPAERYILRLCDGRRTARDLATAILTQHRAIARSESEVVDLLSRLVAKRLVTWRLEVASELHPERALQARIERIGDPAARKHGSSALSALVAARDRVAEAAGRPEDLECRLRELDETFSHHVGRPPVRRAGQTYAARGLVYEDSRRACDVRLGSRFLSRLGPPLSIALDGARWAATEYGRAVARHIHRRFAELRARQPQRAVDAHLLFNYVRATPEDQLAALSRSVTERYQEKWQSIVGTDDGSGRIERSVAEVAERARDAFRTDGSRWSRAWYFSPDIMVAARDLVAFRRGAYDCVLGEVHSTNSLVWSALASQHPDPRSLVEAIAADTRHLTMIATQEPKEEWTARLNPAAVPPTAWRYEFGEDLPSLPAYRSLPAGKLLAIEDGETVRIRARDGSLEFDAFELFGAPLCRQVNRIIGSCWPEAAHTPRITIDGLTVLRERWFVTPAGMRFLAERDRAARFLAVRAWARERRLPRHVFVKSPNEIKPCYLDFDSVVYVESFVRLVRCVDQAATVRIVEMFPGFNDLWLVDREGTRYTAEFRLAALELPQ